MGTNEVAAALVASSGTLVRPELFNCLSTSTAASSAGTSGVEAFPVSGSSAMTGGGEGAQVLVSGREQIEMAMVARLPICGRSSRGLQPRHADVGADELSYLVVGHGRVSEHVKHFVEQPPTLDLGAGTVHHPLGQLVTRPRVRAGQRLIEQLHQLVQDFDVGLGECGEQDRVPPVDVGAL